MARFGGFFFTWPRSGATAPAPTLEALRVGLRFHVILVVMAALDLTGQTFNRLTVRARAENRGGERHWHCECECGRTAIVRGSQLRSGKTKSCGCLSSELSGERAQALFTRHGHFQSGELPRAYGSWQAMKTRCSKPSHPHYYRYGGRGITVCARWLDDFTAFLEDMGEQPPGTSLDRIDNDKGYEPGNCRWATPQEQSNNQTRNRNITVDGETATLAEWSRRCGVSYVTLRARLNAGWDAATALATPTRPKRPST